MNNNIWALVVTYNRKDYLAECIKAILNQTIPVEKLYIIDNNSNDGTQEYVESLLNKESKIKYIRLDKNLGGAGGFYEGIKAITKDTNDGIVWLMDDDTIATDYTVEEFLNSKKVVEDNFSFIASTVVGENNEAMNVPVISNETDENGYKNWYKLLDHNMVKIKNATFVSLFIKIEAIKSVGLPRKDYFIWGDDTEYTQRLVTKYGPAYLSGKSRVVHKRKNARTLSLLEEEIPGRIKLYLYYYRNMLTNLSLYESKKAVMKKTVRIVIESYQLLFKRNVSYRVKKFSVMHIAVWAYYFK